MCFSSKWTASYGECSGRIVSILNNTVCLWMIISTSKSNIVQSFFTFILSEIYHFLGVDFKHILTLEYPNFPFRAEALDTGSPDPRSSERRCLSSLSGTLSACPTCFLHAKFPSPKSQGYSQTLTPSIPRILEGADQSFFLSN